MTEIIDLTNNEFSGMVHVNRIMQSKDENRMTVKFPRTFRTFFKNDWREQSIKMIDDGHKDAESFHGRKDNVPVYNIFKYHGKESFKIGFALPRLTKTDKRKKYLYIPKTTKPNQRVKISRAYYIFDVDDDYNINNRARLMFQQ